MNFQYLQSEIMERTTQALKSVTIQNHKSHFLTTLTKAEAARWISQIRAKNQQQMPNEWAHKLNHQLLTTSNMCRYEIIREIIEYLPMDDQLQIHKNMDDIQDHDDTMISLYTPMGTGHRMSPEDIWNNHSFLDECTRKHDDMNGFHQLNLNF